MTALSAIEMRDIRLETRIGTYGLDEVVPGTHSLDLTLWIDPSLILISKDGMAQVFNYDPLLTEIDRLSRDGRYETQECLVSRIVSACAGDPVITALEIALRKSPGPTGSGAVGVRVMLDADTLNGLR